MNQFIEETKIVEGILTVQTEHTTCSVFFEEMVHDFDIKGDEFLQVDLNKGLEKLFPNQTSNDGYYRYPGPEHLRLAETNQAFIGRSVYYVKRTGTFKSDDVGSEPDVCD